MYERAQVETISRRMAESDNPLMQVVVGPRQTGKSTMLTQALAKQQAPSHFVSADDALLPSAEWLRTEWQQARNMAQAAGQVVLLVVDEVQKVPHWPSAVKALWDSDRRTGCVVKVFLSGSSSLLLHKGLEDSLMGRYELVHSPHWSYAECKDAFGFTLDDYLCRGGYPGAARFIDDEARWGAYLRDAVIEPTISQDVLALGDVRKPALMRAVFTLGAMYSSQELSYTKMLGQLQDAGNTVTVANYLDLLGKAGMVATLEKFDAKALRRRRSSPRLMVYDTSLMTATSGLGASAWLREPDRRGHLAESAVGALLLARGTAEGFSVFWWREGNDEVDFVLQKGEGLVALEVKSGHESGQSGMGAFLARYPHARRIVVGGASSGAVPLERFLEGDYPLFW